MTKKLKINIKNAQIADAVNLDHLKASFAKKELLGKESKSKKTRSTAAKPDLGKSISSSKKSGAAKKTTKTEELPEEVKARPKQLGRIVKKAVKEQLDQEGISSHVTSLPQSQEIELDKVDLSSPAIHEEKEQSSISLQEEQLIEKVRLGPTGKHVNDLLKQGKEGEFNPSTTETPTRETPAEDLEKRSKKKVEKPHVQLESKELEEDDETGSNKKKKGVRIKEFKDFKSSKVKVKQVESSIKEDEEGYWQRRRGGKEKRLEIENVIRPTELTVRLPTTVKDLAQEMKLKASQLISKLLMQGIVVTLNDLLDDDTTIQLLGEEFGCTIHIDTSEAKRVKVTEKSIKEEIKEAPVDDLKLRAPVVVFMGHVDHGKTSLIDYIRKSHIAKHEAGAITQHMGAFCCQTTHGKVTILDTPGHEAFSAMRARGAEVTDIVILVIAGDEGIKQQTDEAIQHAKAAGVTIIVAINKCDKPNFNVDQVYRQLADRDLLPESWGGNVITVNCSAATGEGVDSLLEMIALQSEILELKANPHTRARGTVLESEMHKGLGTVATLLVQNGTLYLGDALVFARHWAKVKTMHDENKQSVESAGPSTAVKITGLSGLPNAGDEFVVVANEKEAKDIAQIRFEGQKEKLQAKKFTLESFLESAEAGGKKILNIILRADVQGSVEALKASLLKIHSEKVKIEFVFSGIGEISESDVQLALASKAVIVGYHTAIEAHTEPLIKEYGVKVCLHDVIYHVIDEVKELMLETLDKIEEQQEKGEAEVRATFKASSLGVIAGCLVTSGSIARSHRVRLLRNGELIWKGSMHSLKRNKDDVREVQKGLECGILLDGYNMVQVGDIIQSYEIIYRTQEL